MLAAATHPDVPMIWSSGDSAWAEGQDYRPDLTNLGNVMGQMEYGKMIAGCAAALTTQTGSIGYLGPLINDETRRLVNSAYLGAATAGRTTGQGPGRPELHRQLDRLLVQHPRRHARPDPGHQRLLRLAAPTSSSRASTRPRPSCVPASGPPPARPSGPSPTTTGRLRRGARRLPGRPYFNWGPAYLEIAQIGHRRHVRSRRSSGSARTGRTSTTPTPRRSASCTGPALRRRTRRAHRRRSSPGWPTARSTCGPARSTTRTARAFLAEGETATDQQIWYTTQLLEGIER